MSKRKKFRLYSSILWLIVITPIFVVFGLFYFASVGGFGEMPDLEVLENPKTKLASEVISSDNKTLGKYYFNDNRTPVTFEELPTHLVDALIATEDIRFYSHSGIDFKRTFGAVIKFGKDGGVVQLRSSWPNNYLLERDQEICLKGFRKKSKSILLLFA